MNPLDPLEREPSWLTAAADQRVAKMKDVAGNMITGYDVIMMMLTEPPEWATPTEAAAWEHECDNCRTSERPLITGNVERTARKKRVFIVFGACRLCLDQP